MPTQIIIQAKDRDAIINSLRSGVVPRNGLQYIQVGRVNEVTAAIEDIDRIADDGSAFRLIIGDYGAGKTFFLHLVRAIALEKKLVTMNADLNPDRRLHSTSGQARSLYAELLHNMSTKSKPDGSALSGIVEVFIRKCISVAKHQGKSPENVLILYLNRLSEYVGGYDFAHVIECYWEGYRDVNEKLKTDAIRWLRGEFINKADAKRALGVRTIVCDANIYDQLKLLTCFVKIAGYSGLLVCLDEMVNLYKLSNPQARNANYEQILRILNDRLQGSCQGLGFMFGGTSDFLTDSRRGLYSYEALRSRLQKNTFAYKNLVDYKGPILSLAHLTPENFYVLLTRLRNVYAYGNQDQFLIPDDAIEQFMSHFHDKLGQEYYLKPRNTVITFINLLDILSQNPDANWQDLLGNLNIPTDQGSDSDTDSIFDDNQDSSLASFRL